MTVSYTQYLRLKIDSNITANAKYNLRRLDTLGGTFELDSANQLNIRSSEDIKIEPQSSDVGGLGTGGTVYIGTAAHEIAALVISASSVLFSDPISLLDQASTGTKYLNLKYKSDLHGSVDTTSDRTLSIDLEGADRELVLGSNLRVTGANLVLTLTSPLSLTLPSGYGTTGQVLSTNGSGTLSWHDQLAGGDVHGYSTDWSSGEGLMKTVTHSLGTEDIEVSVIDSSTGELILVDTMITPDADTLILTASEIPDVSWRITVQAKP